MKIKIMKSGDDFWPRPTNVVVRFDSIGDKVFVTLGNIEFAISIGEEEFRDIYEALERSRI